MQLPKSEQLNIASLSRLFDNKAECYKLFWFQAILNHVCKGQQEIRFEELIDDMIANAWYMVTEYHLIFCHGDAAQCETAGDSGLAAVQYGFGCDAV